MSKVLIVDLLSVEFFIFLKNRNKKAFDMSGAHASVNFVEEEKKRQLRRALNSGWF